MSIRMRHTRSHTRNRRSHHALLDLRIVKDEKGNLRLPHRIDEATGMYNGMQIVVAREQKTKGPRTKKEKVEKKERAHTHTREVAAPQKQKGFFGRLMSSRPKARSGAGGGGA